MRFLDYSGARARVPPKVYAYASPIYENWYQVAFL